jgi:hypothetical protein
VDQVAALQIFLLQQAQAHLDKVPLVAMAELVGLVLAAVLAALVVQQLVVLEYYGPIQIVIMVVVVVHRVMRVEHLLLEVLEAVDQVLNILVVFLLQQVLQGLVAVADLEVI